MLKLDAFQSFPTPGENTVRARLAGFVLNDSTGVTLEVEGAAQALDDLLRSLRKEVLPVAA